MHNYYYTFIANLCKSPKIANSAVLILSKMKICAIFCLQSSSIWKSLAINGEGEEEYCSFSQSPEVPKASIRSKESSKSVNFVWDVVIVLFSRNNTLVPLVRLEKLEATVTLLKMTELLYCVQLEAQLTKFSLAHNAVGTAWQIISSVIENWHFVL